MGKESGALRTINPKNRKTMIPQIAFIALVVLITGLSISVMSSYQRDRQRRITVFRLHQQGILCPKTASCLLITGIAEYQGEFKEWQRREQAQKNLCENCDISTDQPLPYGNIGKAEERKRQA